MKVIIQADGVSRGNPGSAAIGATIKNGQGKMVATVSRPIGLATNNQAEYRALIASLEKALQLGAREADIYLDSELVVRQIKNEYRVKNAALKPLYQQAKQLLSSLENFTITHVPRLQNAEADKLANLALK